MTTTAGIHCLAFQKRGKQPDDDAGRHDEDKTVYFVPERGDQLMQFSLYRDGAFDRPCRNVLPEHTARMRQTCLQAGAESGAVTGYGDDGDPHRFSRQSRLCSRGKNSCRTVCERAGSPSCLAFSTSPTIISACLPMPASCTLAAMSASVPSMTCSSGQEALATTATGVAGV